MSRDDDWFDIRPPVEFPPEWRKPALRYRPVRQWRWSRIAAVCGLAVMVGLIGWQISRALG